MTVKYNHLIAEATLLGFPKLLFRWKGSLWKLIWTDLIFFGSIYLFISLMYLYVMNDIQRERFQEVAIYCNLNSFKIPLGFLLGFYVQQVMNRFWLSFKSIPWPTDIAFYTNLSITGEGEDSRLIRRTIIRYICCSFVLTMRSISKPVKKRFPSFAHLVDAGLMTPDEARDIGALNIKFNNYFVPIAWSTKLVGDARKDGLMRRDMDYDRLTRELNDFRSKCGTLLKFDWISLPLVYTQVVSIALYLFCFTCLLGRYPFIKGEASEARFPFFTMAQFIFYMSWLKVGQSVANPFGEDDDDFDINTMIDNFVNESYLIVDRLKTNVPDFKKDKHWDINVALKKLLQHNVEYMGSAAGLLISEEKQAVREIEKADQKL